MPPPFLFSRQSTGEKKNEWPFVEKPEKPRHLYTFGLSAKVKMGKKWEDFFEKLWYNNTVDDWN